MSIVLHEFGHWSAARSLGFPEPALHYGSISHGDITSYPAWMSGVVGLAGPAVTLLLTLFACGWILRRGGSKWAFALSIAAVSRFAIALPYTIVNVGVLLTGSRLTPPAFDEYKAATALGWPADLLLGSTSVVLVLTLVWIGYRLPRGERPAAWGGLLGGTATGWALWMAVVGPVLLP